MMKTTLQLAMLLALVAILCAMPGAAVGQGGGAAAQKKTLQVDGSTTVGPIADEFAEAFKKLYPNIEITVKKTGSGDGAAALIDGRCQVATMSRFMSAEEFKKAAALPPDKSVMPCAHTIALDAVSIVVHPSNPIKGLTLAQVKDIYTGKVTNWKQLGGADLAIVAVSRETSSGTYDTFEKLVMGKDKMFDKVEYVSSSPDAHDRPAATAGAISYVGLGFVDAKVKALEIEGVGPSNKTVLDGTYKLSRPLFMFTNGYPALGSPAQLFVSFYLTEKGQEIIKAKGFVPVTSY
jgi:phosphate transport system substrate-binding protein